MNDTQKVEEWVRHYNAAVLKFNALRAVLENDGQKMLERVLKKLGLESASDVVTRCDDCYLPRK